MRTSKLALLTLSITACLIASCISAQTGTIPTGSDTTCYNGLPLFQKYYGGNKDESGLWIEPTSDSGFIVCGRTKSYGNGGYDGFLMKLNRRGNTVWSRAIGGAGDDIFYTVRVTSDNGFIACGQTRSYGNAAGDAWLVRTDAAGNILWSKKYGDGNSAGEIGYDVVQLSDGGFAFIGSHRFQPGLAEGFVVRTDNLGTPIWSKQYGMSGSDQINGIVEDGSTLVVSGFYQGGSFYDGYLMKLNKTNGAVIWIRGYDAENRSTWMSHLAKTNTGYQAFSIITDNYLDVNQQVCVWNFTTNGDLQNVRKLAIPGTWSLSIGWYPFPDGGFIGLSSEKNNSSDLIMCRVNPSGTLRWSKKYPRAGQQFAASVNTSQQGGWELVGYTSNDATVADSSNIYVLKVDNEGSAGGNCPGINTTDLTVVNPSYAEVTTPISDLGNVNINSPVIIAGVIGFVPPMYVGCTYCLLPPIPIDTICTNKTALYQKTLGGTRDEIGNSIAIAADSGLVIAGRTNSFGNGGYDGLITKLSKKGTPVWSKAFGGANDEIFYSVIRTSDNGFIACGQTKSYGNLAGEILLVKLDAAGNLQWSRKYSDGNPFGEIGYYITQLSDGGYAFTGSHRFAPGNAEGFVARTDNLGNLLWAKQFGIVGSDQLSGIVEDDTYLVVTGFYQGVSFYDGYVMKLNKSNGSIVWMKGLDAESRSTWMNRAAKTNNGYQVMSIITDNYLDNNQQLCFWNLTTDGIVQNVRKLSIPGIWSTSFGWEPLPDGGFIGVNSVKHDTSDVLICRVNANGTLAWSKKYLREGKQLVAALTTSPEGGYAGVGSSSVLPTFADSTNVYVFRVDSLGESGACSGIPTTDVTVVTPLFSSFAPPVADLGTVTINNPVFTIGVVTFTPFSITNCFYCVPKPTGTTRQAETPTGGRHALKVYPNPTSGGTINIAIDALYDDRAVISIVDVNGNVIYTTGNNDIRKGVNLIGLNIPNRLHAYIHYFVRVRFTNSESTIKIFVIK